jgi:membrane protein
MAQQIFCNSRLGDMKNMKKLMMLFCFVLSCCTMANAHAGLADRYLEMIINVDALVLVFAVTQVSTYLFLKYSKSKVSCWYKKHIIRIAKKVHKKSHIKWCASWALSSLVFTPYVMGLCTEFFFLAFIPLVVFLIYYSCMVLNLEKRKMRLIGIRGLSLLLSVSFQQALGYLVYALICETSTFHRFAYYTDEGYEMFDLKLYPGIEAFNYIKEWFAFISIITAIPFIVLFIMRTWRYFCIKF